MREPPAGTTWVTATRGRTRVAPGAAPELQLSVTLPARGAPVRLDGSVVSVEGTLLRVEGPERDVFVTAGGVALARARGARLAFDLQSAYDREAARAGRERAFAPDALAAAIAAEAVAGVRHRYEVVPDPVPAGVAPTIVVRSDRALGACRCHWTTDGTAPADPVATGGGAVALEPVDHHRTHWQATLPAAPAGSRVRYRIAARAGAGPAGRWEPVADAAAAYTLPVPHILYRRPRRDAFSYVAGPPPPPRWAREATMYHLLVDRWARHGGEGVAGPEQCEPLGFAGGTLRGAVERLDHVAGLGVDAVLLSPITPGEMHCAYDVKDLCAVEPRLGTLDDARRLCAEAHRLGLRVVLDLELSYLGGRHPMALQALADPDSPAAGWFHRSEDPPRLWGWMGGNPMFRPVDHHHGPARRALLESARFWLDVGFDGFRLDSAHAAPLDFWAELGQVVHSHDPEAFVFGEVTAPHAERLRLRGRLTGYLDFDTEHAIRRLAGTGEGAPSEVDRAARSGGAEPLLAPVTFVESHDDSRLSLLAGGDERRIRLAHLLLLTLPGSPLLLYGTEAGLDQERDGHLDLELRRPMPWDAIDHGRLAWMGAMVALRRDRPALRRGSYEPLVVDDAAGFLAFTRTASGERLLVAVNASPEPARRPVHWEDRTVELSLAPWEGRILDPGGTTVASTR